MTTDDWYFVRKQTPEFESQWRYVTTVTREMAGEWAVILARATEEFRNQIPADAMEAALEAGNGDLILREPQPMERYVTELRGWETPIRAVFDRAAKAELGRLKLGIRFDIRNPYAEQWIQRHTAELVTQVTEETQRSIRAIVLESFERGIPIREAARTIRPLIGLATRDSKAVLNYWRSLNQEADLSARQVNGLTETYASRLLRRRAENIARTEAVSAANAGTQESWFQAQQQGLVAPESLQEWIAAVGSPRTCPECLELDGQRVPLGQPFTSSTRGPVYRPTLHPSCRCVLALVTEIPTNSR